MIHSFARRLPLVVVGCTSLTFHLDAVLRLLLLSLHDVHLGRAELGQQVDQQVHGVLAVA